MTERDEIPLDITGHEDRERPGTDESTGDDSGSPNDQTGRSADESDGQTARSADGSDDQTARSADDSDDQAANSADEGNTVEGNSSSESDPDYGPEEEVEPIEVLVQLAEDGEIDPWDIDIVEVTDKFLDRLDEADLRTSGRALFYASVLLRMKSDAMLAPDQPEEPEPWEQPLDEDAQLDGPDPFASLEREMDRRLERKRARGMPQTLDELVRDLRQEERDTWWKESREYDTSGSPEGFGRGTQELDYHAADEFRMDDEPTAAEVTEKTHGEDIEAIIDEVYAAIREQYDNGRVEVLFREVETAGGTRVETFLGLLFLSHRGHVRLRQDELFGDLWIQDPSAVAGSDEAVAD